ncbi:MAG TPA: hypothetical protein VNO70_02385 [Blastocatellia bacterium]|nr:hypothetical protein [Blastocatellia bacterium]
MSQAEKPLTGRGESHYSAPDTIEQSGKGDEEMKATKALAVITAILFAGFITSAYSQQLYRLTEQEMRNLLERIEKGSDNFRASLDAALDKSRFDDSKTEDNINEFVKAYETATDRLKERWNDKDSATGAVEEVLTRAGRIDNFMARHELTARAQEDWAYVRKNLDELAQAYNVTWTWAGVSHTPHRVTDKEVRSALDQIEKRADSFRASLDAALDDSRFDDSKAEDEINRYVKEFEGATDRLEDRFGKNQSAASDVEEVLRRAAAIDDFMRRHSLTPQAQSDWAALRGALDQLAEAYQVTWTWDRAGIR